MTTADMRDKVVHRANGRCEYCRLPQAILSVRFHVEHVVPRIHGGTDSLENLALACPRCNCYKGPNLTSRDPLTGNVTRLFDPRRQNWQDHFRSIDDNLVGITDVGHATIHLLRMNDEHRLRLRRELRLHGEL
ncbi:MAG: HNH endonuclease [Pirellulales bacterium]|nr:HNH endonuclease [Pirellulales bacterium]